MRPVAAIVELVLNLQRRPVAQDGLGGEGRLAEQVPDYPGRKLGLDQIEDPAPLCTRAVDKVARIQRLEIVGPQEAAVCFGFGPGVAAEPATWTGCPESHRRPGASRSRFLTMRGMNCSCTRLRAQSPHQVAGVPCGLVQEALRAWAEGQELVGYVGDGLVGFGPRVEVQQGRNDF